MPSMEVHVTERATFKMCHRKWMYQYVNKYQKKDVFFNALWFGTLMHKCLAHYYLNKIDPVQMYLNEFENQTKDRLPHLPEYVQTKVEEMRIMGLYMVQGYLQKYQTEEWEIVSVEKPLSYSVEIGGEEIQVCGTMDMVVRYQDRLWVVDHKTYAKFVDPTDLIIDDQMTTYLFLLWKNNPLERIGGAIYNQLLKKVPDTPKVLKSGALSKDMKVYTTRALYEMAIEENGLDKGDYEDVLERLANVEFFRREPIGRSKRELALFESQLYTELEDMLHFRDNPAKCYPNQTRDCKERCQYLDLCKCQSQGGNADYMASILYKQHDTNHGTDMETEPEVA